MTSSPRSAEDDEIRVATDDSSAAIFLEAFPGRVGRLVEEFVSLAIQGHPLADFFDEFFWDTFLARVAPVALSNVPGNVQITLARGTTAARLTAAPFRAHEGCAQQFGLNEYLS